jgi:hypothetical protein
MFNEELWHFDVVSQKKGGFSMERFLKTWFVFTEVELTAVNVCSTCPIVPGIELNFFSSSHVGPHVRNHIFICHWPISNKPSKSWNIKTNHRMRAVVWLVNIFYYHSLIGRSKINERFSDMTSYGMYLALRFHIKINRFPKI